jgi:outer membrane lipoprotein SlyB
LFPRFNSALSQYSRKARYSHRARHSYKTRRFVREHTRISVAVAAAVTAVAGIGAASAVVGSTPWGGAAASMAAANSAGRGTLAGQARQTIVRSITGVHLKSGGGQGEAESQQQGPSRRQAPSKPQTPSRRQAPSKPQTPSQPYLIYDSTEPSTVPVGQLVATYADGPFAVSPYEVAGHGKVLWIDTNGSDPQASALDVEPGDATPAIAGQWVQQKLTAQPKATAIIYTSLGEWQEVQAAIGTLPASMQSHVKYWIANPTGIPHMIPGASATQWYWGSTYDISTAEPGFWQASTASTAD